jgi:hypothetical protein
LNGIWNVPEDVLNLLQQLDSQRLNYLLHLVSGIQGLPHSLLLVGSWAQSLANGKSDLDLLLLAKNPIQKKDYLRLVRALGTKNRNLRNRVDCKVMTYDEFKTDSGTAMYHLIHYLSTKHGILLSGTNVNSVVLNNDLVLNGLDIWTERVQDSIFELEESRGFTKCATICYEAAKSCFFAERLLLGTSINKRERLEDLFKPISKKVVNAYYGVVKQLGPSSLHRGEVKIKPNLDKKYLQEEHSHLLTSAHVLSSDLVRVRRKIALEYSF